MVVPGRVLPFTSTPQQWRGMPTSSTPPRHRLHRRQHGPDPRVRRPGERSGSVSPTEDWLRLPMDRWAGWRRRSRWNARRSGGRGHHFREFGRFSPARRRCTRRRNTEHAYASSRTCWSRALMASSSSVASMVLASMTVNSVSASSALASGVPIARISTMPRSLIFAVLGVGGCRVRQFFAISTQRRLNSVTHSDTGMVSSLSSAPHPVEALATTRVTVATMAGRLDRLLTVFVVPDVVD